MLSSNAMCFLHAQMQDVRDNEDMRAYQAPRRQDNGENAAGGAQRGFVVRDAPWSPPAGAVGGKNAPDTNSMSEFPEFGLSAAPASGGGSSRWGPRR